MCVLMCVLCVYAPSAWNKTDDDDNDDAVLASQTIIISCINSQCNPRRRVDGMSHISVAELLGSAHL